MFNLKLNILILRLMTFLNYTIKKGNQKKQISTIRYHFVSIRLVKIERRIILIVSMDMRQMI